MLFQVVQLFKVCVSEENTEAKKVTHCQSSYNFKTSCKVTVGGQIDNLYSSNSTPYFLFPLSQNLPHGYLWNFQNDSPGLFGGYWADTPPHQNDGSRRDPGLPDVGLWRKSAENKGSRAVVEMDQACLSHVWDRDRAEKI